MSWRTLEIAINLSAKKVLCNPKLRLKDLLEWSTGEVSPRDGEIVIEIGDGLNVSAVYKKEMDKRQPV